MGDHSQALRDGTRASARSWGPSALTWGSLYPAVGPATGDMAEEGSILEGGLDFTRQVQLGQGTKI